MVLRREAIEEGSNRIPSKVDPVRCYCQTAKALKRSAPRLVFNSFNTTDHSRIALLGGATDRFKRTYLNVRVTKQSNRVRLAFPRK